MKKLRQKWSSQTSHSPQTGKQELANTTPFVNFNQQSLDGYTSTDWYAAKKFTSPSTLKVSLGKDCPPVYNIMFFHSNLVVERTSSRFFYRSFYQQILVSEVLIPDWPIFKANQKKVPHDGFDLQLCLNIDDRYTTFMSSEPLEGILDKKDKLILLEINYKRKFEIEVTLESNHLKKICFVMIQSQEYHKKRNLRVHNLNEDVKEQIQESETLIHKKEVGDPEYFADVEHKERFPIFNQFSFLAKYQIQYENIYFDKQFSKTAETQLKQSLTLPNIAVISKFFSHYSNELNIEGGQLKNSQIIAVFDQILSKADFIFDKIWIFQSTKRDQAYVVINVDGKPQLIPSSFELHKKKKKKQQKILLKYAHFRPFTDRSYIPAQRIFKSVLRAILLEECLAIVFNGHRKLQWGKSGFVFMMLTNHPTKIYRLSDLLDQKKKIIIDILKEWTAQFDWVKDKYKQVMNRDENKHLQRQTSCFLLEEKDILGRYKFIVISGIQYGALQWLFGEQHKFDYPSFTEHSFSFQGIFFPQHNSNQQYMNIKDNCFVKLRDPMGATGANKWRIFWNKKHEKNGNIKPKNDLYAIFGQQILINPNEFIMTLQEFFKLHAEMEVCTYYPRSNYSFQPIYLQNDKASNFTINIQEVGNCFVTLHQADQRRLAKYTENAFSYKKEVQSWKYPKVQFVLSVLTQDNQKLYSIPYVEHNIREMTFSLSYPFNSVHSKFILKIGKEGKQYEKSGVNFRPNDYLSILTTPLDWNKDNSNFSLESKNYLAQDYTCKDTEQLKFTLSCNCEGKLNRKKPFERHLIESTIEEFEFIVTVQLYEGGERVNFGQENIEIVATCIDPDFIVKNKNIEFKDFKPNPKDQLEKKYQSKMMQQQMKNQIRGKYLVTVSANEDFLKEIHSSKRELTYEISMKEREMTELFEELEGKSKKSQKKGITVISRK